MRDGTFNVNIIDFKKVDKPKGGWVKKSGYSFSLNFRPFLMLSGHFYACFVVFSLYLAIIKKKKKERKIEEEEKILFI